jgi:hypothetical protein
MATATPQIKTTPTPYRDRQQQQRQKVHRVIAQALPAQARMIPTNQSSVLCKNARQLLYMR